MHDDHVELRFGLVAGEIRPHGLELQPVRPCVAPADLERRLALVDKGHRKAARKGCAACGRCRVEQAGVEPRIGRAGNQHADRALPRRQHAEHPGHCSAEFRIVEEPLFRQQACAPHDGGEMKLAA